MWLDEYNSRLTTEEKHTPGLIILQDDTEGFLQQNPGKLNLIPCEFDLSSTPFFYIETMITYEIELLPSGKKIGLNLWMIMTLPPHIFLMPLPTHRQVTNLKHKLSKIY